MMDATFEEVVKLAEQLDPEQQNLLIYRLRVKQMEERAAKETAQPAPPREYSRDWLIKRGTEYIESYRSPTREELIQDAEILRDTPVHPDNSLLGKYANPNVPDMSEEEFHAQMHTIATEWEQELDDFSSDES
jgi:hypothetical protein